MLVLCNVDQELKQEHEHVHLEILVVRNVLDLCLKHDRAAVQLVSINNSIKDMEGYLQPGYFVDITNNCP